jgi:hypothetical protein
MAAKKKAKNAAKKILTEAQRKKIKSAIQNAEDKVIANYKKAAGMSGADWKKQSTKVKAKVKKDMARAKARVEAEVRKNPAGATVAAAAIGALVGALVMSKLKRR